MTVRQRPESDPSGPAPTYQIKITLLDTDPPIWRRVLVPGSIALPKLHRVIQAAMSWSNDHLHEFAFREKRQSPEERLRAFFVPRNRRPQPKTLAGRVPNRGSKFRYTYDFGDCWVHEILVEKVLPPDAAAVLPVCVAGERAAPPEDCGGAWAYQELLEAISDPKHPGHGERIEWLGSDFDPERFDVTEVNSRLKRIKC